MNRWESFSMDQVLLTDEYMVNSLNLEVDYLLEFQVDKLLSGFRETAGLDYDTDSYGGYRPESKDSDSQRSGKLGCTNNLPRHRWGRIR